MDNPKSQLQQDQLKCGETNIMQYMEVNTMQYFKNPVHTGC